MDVGYNTGKLNVNIQAAAEKINFLVGEDGKVRKRVRLGLQDSGVVEAVNKINLALMENLTNADKQQLEVLKIKLIKIQETPKLPSLRGSDDLLNACVANLKKLSNAEDDLKGQTTEPMKEKQPMQLQQPESQPKETKVENAPKEATVKEEEIQLVTNLAQSFIAIIRENDKGFFEKFLQDNSVNDSTSLEKKLLSSIREDNPFSAADLLKWAEGKEASIQAVLFSNLKKFNNINRDSMEAIEVKYAMSRMIKYMIQLDADKALQFISDQKNKISILNDIWIESDITNAKPDGRFKVLKLEDYEEVLQKKINEKSQVEQ